MLRRTVLPVLLVLAVVVLVPHSSADDSRSATLNDATVKAPKAEICAFLFVLKADGASLEQVKKLLMPYQIIDIRKVKATEVVVQYVVRISCLGDKKKVKATVFREDLPPGDRDRVNIRSILIDIMLLSDTKK